MSGVIVDALAARFGGTALAAAEVSRHLAADRRFERVIVVTRAGSLVSEVAGAGDAVLAPSGRFELVRRLSWEATALPRLAEGGDAVLSWSGMLPRRPAGRLVSYLANPVAFDSDRLPDRLRRAAMRRTAAWSHAVLVPTEAMRERVAAVTDRDPDVVALGVDHARFTPVDPPGEELLCVGDFYAHKRHDLVLAAWERLPEPRPRLRLVGDARVAEGHAKRVLASVADHVRAGSVVVETGLRLADPAFVAAYRRARALVVCSEQESFSMPLLEAQACGVPAVARDTPVLRETGGPGTTFVAGDDAGSWSRAIGRLFADDAAHAAAREAGVAHAAGYSWERTAAEIADRLL